MLSILGSTRKSSSQSQSKTEFFGHWQAENIQSAEHNLKLSDVFMFCQVSLETESRSVWP